MPKLSFFFRWYDLWVGAYIDWRHRTVYVCPLPTLGIMIELRHEHDWVRMVGREVECCAICGATRRIVRVVEEVSTWLLLAISKKLGDFIAQAAREEKGG